jgi:hypothetical protein
MAEEPEVDDSLNAGEKLSCRNWTLFAEDYMNQTTSSGTDSLLLENTK